MEAVQCHWMGACPEGWVVFRARTHPGTLHRFSVEQHARCGGSTCVTMTGMCAACVHTHTHNPACRRRCCMPWSPLYYNLCVCVCRCLFATPTQHQNTPCSVCVRVPSTHAPPPPAPQNIQALLHAVTLAPSVTALLMPTLTSTHHTCRKRVHLLILLLLLAPQKHTGAAVCCNDHSVRPGHSCDPPAPRGRHLCHSLLPDPVQLCNAGRLQYLCQQRHLQQHGGWLGLGWDVTGTPLQHAESHSGGLS